MADKSLTYFLFFIAVWLSYGIYEQKVENERLFQIAVDQRDKIIQQTDLINAQTIYIKLLEKELLGGYNNTNPLYTDPL